MIDKLIIQVALYFTEKEKHVRLKFVYQNTHQRVCGYFFMIIILA